MSIISLSFLGKSLSSVCQRFRLGSLEFVMHVRLGSNITNLSLVEFHDKLLKYFNLFMPMSIAIWPLFLFLGPSIFCCFLMTLVEKCACIFSKRNQMRFLYFRNLNLYLKKSLGNLLLLLDHTMGEFYSNEFSSFSDTHGIKHQLTTPHTPQQNNVVECWNRTIIEMAQSMLEHRHVPKKF